MKQTSTTGGDRYTSHRLGEITEKEYEAVDKGLSEAREVFGKLRQRPVMIVIEKRDVIHIPPTQCSVFEYHDSMFGKRDEYDTVSQFDVLPVFMDDCDYDGALEQVHSPINRIIEKFFNGGQEIKDSEMYSEIISVCHDSRTYELELFDRRESLTLEYSKGKVQEVSGNLPVDEIVRVLKEAGAWEK